MASNYKRLGNYIQQVDVRNTDLSVELLLGVSIEKKFIESHANTVGTDFSKYKIVKRGQFAYGPVTSRNGDKISIALLDEADACLISSSYTPFEIVKPDELNAEYLMMLFRNPEYDRFARYNSWGSAREVFSWEDFCDSELYIPDIEEQRKIVRQYKMITDRIEVLEKINEKLDELLSLMYYELNKVESILLKQLTTKEKGVKTGKGADDFSINETETDKFPVIGASGIMGYTSKFLYDKRIISTGRVGTIGKVMLWDGPNWFTDNSLVIESDYIATMYCLLKQYNFGEILGGSSNPKITQTDLNNVVFDIPSDDDMKLFENKGKNIIDLMILIRSEIKVLEQLKERLISNL